MHKLNWKSHNDRQKTYVNSSIESKGWARHIVVNVTTGNVIDGHGRIEISVEEGRKSVPVDFGWWSEEEERELLVELDTTTGMASVNGAALASLTQKILTAKKGNRNPITELMKDAHSHAKSVMQKRKASVHIQKTTRSFKDIVKETKQKKEKRQKKKQEDNSVYLKVLKDDVTFDSSNQWGIPDLLQSKMYGNVDVLPEITFARSKDTSTELSYFCEGARPFNITNCPKPDGGFLGFYTQDWRFEKYYDNAAKYIEKLQEEKWFAVIEPDYSTYWNWPFARRLWSVYRSRWCVRYWQEFGINIIPTIRRMSDPKKETPWMIDTLPKKCPVIAMSVRMGGEKRMKDEDMLNSIHTTLEIALKRIKPKVVLLYGSLNYEKYLVGYIPSKLEYRFVEPFMDARRTEMIEDE